MLRWFRTRDSWLAAVTLLAMVTLGGANIAPHADDCHDDCVTAVAHDASAHRFQSGTTSAADDPAHCLVCHWARSFRLQVQAATADAPQADASGIALPELVPVARTAAITQPSLRAPPALSHT